MEAIEKDVEKWYVWLKCDRASTRIRSSKLNHLFVLRTTDQVLSELLRLSVCHNVIYEMPNIQEHICPVMYIKYYFKYRISAIYRSVKYIPDTE